MMAMVRGMPIATLQYPLIRNRQIVNWPTVLTRYCYEKRPKHGEPAEKWIASLFELQSKDGKLIRPQNSDIAEWY